MIVIMRFSIFSFKCFYCSYGSSLKPKSCLVQRHSTGNQLTLTPINKQQTTSMRNR